jgi:glycosyltransferase involved in cell wall biosynthesis
MPEPRSTLRILSVVEATTINAVARNVLGFYRSARELSQKFAEPPIIGGSLVTFDRRGGNTQSPSEFVTAAGEDGLETDVIAERRRFDLSVIPALRTIVEKRRPDIVVTHSVKSHFLMWRSRLWKEFPWVAFHHGYTTTDRKMRLYNRLDRWSLTHADRVITVCQAFAQELANMIGVPAESISVQHNSIRPEPPPSEQDVRSLRSRFEIADDERVVLAVGRFSKEKGHIDLLAAFKCLRETHPELNSKLIIVGEGLERVKLEAAAESSGCKERIILAGQVRNVQPFYALASVLALPSHSEGSPNVLLEAMAAGVPVVATSVGGVPEMVEDNESALLVPARDAQTMVAAIARILTDKELARRLTTNAAELVAARFGPETYARNLVEIYREVIDVRQSLVRR